VGNKLGGKTRARLHPPAHALRAGAQVMVSVLAEDPLSGARRVACTALVTYVSADRRQLPFATPGATAGAISAACGLSHSEQRLTKNAHSGWMRVYAGGSVLRAVRATTFCLRWIHYIRILRERHRNKQSNFAK
jgi:acyl-CoA hydrolase